MKFLELLKSRLEITNAERNSTGDLRPARDQIKFHFAGTFYASLTRSHNSNARRRRRKCRQLTRTNFISRWYPPGEINLFYERHKQRDPNDAVLFRSGKLCNAVTQCKRKFAVGEFVMSLRFAEVDDVLPKSRRRSCHPSGSYADVRCVVLPR